MSKESFILYTSQYEAIKDMTLEQKGKLLDALYLHALGDAPPPDDAVVRMAFAFIRERMDSNNVRYESICERNRQNGSKGGRPKRRNDAEEETQKPNGLNIETQKPNGFDTETQQNPNNPNNPLGFWVSKSKTQKTQKTLTDTDTEYLNTEIQKETPLKGVKKSGQAAFSPPSVEEVSEYISMKGYHDIDAEAFVCYYESVGWMIGKGKKMHNWKAALVTWKKRQNIDNRNKNANSYGNNTSNSPIGTGGNNAAGSEREARLQGYAALASKYLNQADADLAARCGADSSPLGEQKEPPGVLPREPPGDDSGAC